MLRDWLPFLIYGLFALVVPTSMIVASFVFAQRPARRTRARGLPFESGVSRGASVDYLETIQESGFKIDNPNAVSSCGCGSSFQVAEGEAPEDAVGGCGSGCSH